MEKQRNPLKTVRATTQGVGILALIMLVTMCSFSFTTKNVVTIYGGDNFLNVVNYLPSGEHVSVKENVYVEVENVDYCFVNIRLDESGGGWIGKNIPAKKRTKVSFKLSEFTKPEKLIFSVLPIGMVRQKRITMVNLKYPYGKTQTYMGGSTIATISRFKEMGHEVEYVDFNLDIDPREKIVDILNKESWWKMLNIMIVSEKFKMADLIAISVTGAPYIPSMIELSKFLSATYKKPVIVGGQIIEQLTSQQFEALMQDKWSMLMDIRQIKTDADLAKVLDCDQHDLPNPYTISYISAWECIGNDKLKNYLSNEMTMVLSQGCHFKCGFCAAKKARVEQFKSIECFEKDMRFLADSARKFGLTELQFYATSLDFFQNPKKVFAYLEILADIQKETGVKFKIRCLSCLPSFIQAVKKMGEASFRNLMERSGLWCVGLGVDGTDEKVWKAQKKNQNKISDIKDCLDLAQAVGIRSEILMIMGFPEQSFKTLFKCVTDSIRYVRHWPNTILRPYLAKDFIPGNDSWASDNSVVQSFISDPKKFYNLDFCAVGSKITHPRFWHRTWSNLSYLAIIGILTPFGRCATSPLLPQGNDGLYGKFAKWFNKKVPFDR